MEIQLVNSKTAKLAKEKGFNVNCSKYTKNGKLVGAGNQSGVYNAPTQSLLQKWLREKHNIHIEISLDDCEGITKYDVALYWINPEAMWTKISRKNFNTHEDALEEGLYEALLLIKNKNK